MKDICFIDFETTGIHLDNDHPIEMGACMYDTSRMKVVNTFHSFISPPEKSSMSEVAQKIHGVTLEQAIERGVTPMTAAYNFFIWAAAQKREFSFGGWNVQFDISFFRRMCYENDFDEMFHNNVYYRHVDVQAVIRTLCECGFYDHDIKSLDNACKEFGIKRNEYHGAVQDAYITAEVYTTIRKAMWKRLVARAGL
jgi:DNA polymerase III epsilon subunit-like protein